MKVLATELAARISDLAEQARDTMAAPDLPLLPGTSDDIRDRSVASFLFATIAPCLCPLLKFNVLCVRPIGLSDHLMEGKGEPTYVAMLCQPNEAAELIGQASTKDGSQSTNAALSILYVVSGLGSAAHGAQKLFSWFGGGRINGT